MATLVNLGSYFKAQALVVQDLYSNSTPTKPRRWPDLFNQFKIDQDRSFWNAMSLIGFGTLAVRDEGQVATIDSSKQGLVTMYPYITYALRYLVTKEMAREDAKSIIPMLPGLLRYSKDQTIEFLVWNVLNLSFTNAASGGYNLADGQPLCSDAHPCIGAPGLTYSNTVGPAALTVETLNQVFTLMANMPDDRGLTTSRMPEDIWYPIQLHQNVIEVLSAYYYPDSNENRPNTVAGSVKPHAIEYITSQPTGPFPWWVTSGKGALGTDAHTLFTNVKWDEQRAYFDQPTQTMIHEVEVRLQWGAVEGRGVVGSEGA